MFRFHLYQEVSWSITCEWILNRLNNRPIGSLFSQSLCISHWMPIFPLDTRKWNLMDRKIRLTTFLCKFPSLHFQTFRYCIHHLRKQVLFFRLWELDFVITYYYFKWLILNWLVFYWRFFTTSNFKIIL